MTQQIADDEIEIAAGRARLTELVFRTMTEKDLSVEQLAANVGMRPVTVHEFISGKRNLEFRSAVRMLFSMGVRLDMDVVDI